MNRPTALSLLICFSTLLPLQVTYADTISATKPSNNAEQPVSTTTSVTPPVLQVTVATQHPILSEEAAADLIQVTKAPLPLSSKLQKSYEAYRITVQSDYPNTLRLQSASVNNAQSGAMAY